MASERQHPDMTIEEELGHAMIARAEMEMMWAESHDEVQRLRTLLAERDAEVAWLVVRAERAEAAIREALYDYDHGDEISAIDRLRAALAARGDQR